MALLCTKWKSQDKQDKNPQIFFEDKTTEHKEIPYQPLEDAEFDKVFEQMNEIRMTNTNKDITDEERRKKAENAIMILSKYLNLDDGEEDESD
jgi:hypothetical protein